MSVRTTPVCFADIEGQDRAVAQLQRAARHGRLAHCYLFTGPSGVGKYTAARALAAYFLCPTNGDDACGQCAACLAMGAEGHPDFLEWPERPRSLLDADKGLASEPAHTGKGKKKDAPKKIKTESNRRIGIDAIRQLEMRIQRTPVLSETMVVVIRDAENLTREAANAFLKTLEEPPEGVRFILTANQVEQLPETIRSRAQEVYFSELPQAVLLKLLHRDLARDAEEGMALPVQAAMELASELAGGSLDRARELVRDEALLQARRDLFDVLPRLPDLHPGVLVRLTAAYPRKDALEMITARLTFCESWFSDALRHAVAPQSRRRNVDIARPDVPVSVARAALQHIFEARRKLSPSVDATLVFTVLLQTIAHDWRALR